MERIRQHLAIAAFYMTIIALFLLGTVIGNRTVSVISQQLAGPQYHTIVIDPGHGGEDGGAVSCTGKNESMLNLQVSHRLDDLMHLLGLRTIMVRSSDTSVCTEGETILQKKVSDLKNRVHIVNSTPNAVLVSIHQNHFTDSRYYGAQVFYAASSGSRELAEGLQKIFPATINPGSNREIKQGSGVYLLDKIHSPGILVECGFLSNPEEEHKLCDAEYQKKLSCIIASCVSSYLVTLDRNAVS